MRITAQTTDAALTSEVRACRLRLADLLTTAADMTSLTNEIAVEANRIAEDEGTMQARVLVRDALAAGREPESIVAHLQDILLNGADDCWSGRKNDLRRARFDGFRIEARAQIFNLRMAAL